MGLATSIGLKCEMPEGIPNSGNTYKGFRVRILGLGLGLRFGCDV